MKTTENNYFLVVFGFIKCAVSMARLSVFAVLQIPPLLAGHAVTGKWTLKHPEVSAYGMVAFLR